MKGTETVFNFISKSKFKLHSPNADKAELVVMEVPVKGGVPYKLNAPLVVHVTVLEDCIEASCPVLDLVGIGETIDDALAHIYEDFDFMHKEYGESPDDALGKRLLAIVKYQRNLLIPHIEWQY